MVTLLPINFISLGIVGGGIASTLKKSSGLDIRGRILEIVVVALTLLLTAISSGLVRAYFGDASKCWGLFSTTPFEEDEGSPTLKGPFYPPQLNKIILDVPLRQVQLWYLKWDFILAKLGPISHRFLCVPGPDGSTDYPTIGCSPSTRAINPKFYEDEHCSSDLSLLVGVWMSAVWVLAMGHLYKQLRGARRNVAAAHRGRRRPHQD